MITAITRQLSFEDIKPKQKIRYQQILDRLCYGNKTAKIVDEVEICTLSDRFLIPEYEPNYTCRNFERSDT